jgi:hypothetical protein
VRRQLQDAGTRVVLIPERAPNANASSERFIRSIKEECLDRLIPIGPRHFRRAVTGGTSRTITASGTTSDSTIASSRPAGDPDDESRATPSAGRPLAHLL